MAPSETLDRPPAVTVRPSAAMPLLLARLAGTLVLVLAPFIFALALRPFAYGIWFQTEPVTAGLLACGAAACLALVGLALAGQDLHPALRNPALRLLAAFVAWNALASLLQRLPERSWFGTPESGEGVFSFLALLALTALALALWPWRPARLAMAIAASISAVGIGLLDAVLPLGSPWRPELFAAYAGMIGPPSFLIVLGAVRRIDWRVLLLGFAVGLAPVLFSHNKTAIVLGCAVGPFGYFLLRSQWIGRIAPARRRRLFALAPPLALLLTVVSVVVSILLPHWDALYSVRSRGLLALAALQGLGDRLTSLVWGLGWGSYDDVLYRHTYLAWVHGFQNGVWAPNWEGMFAGAFHSHIDTLETVLGGGLPSGVLYLLVFCAAVGSARRAMLPAAAVTWFLVTGALSAWYPFMLGFPFLAVAIAAGTAPLQPPLPAAPLRKRWRLAVPLLAAAVLAWGTLGTVQDAVRGGRLLAALNRQDPGDSGHYLALRQDHGRGGVHLWWCALNYAAFIGSLAAHGQHPTAGQALWYGRMLDAVDQWTARGNAGLRLTALTLALRSDLITGHAGDDLAPLRRREIPHWGDSVLRVVRLAPDRTDVAVPYLSWLASRHAYLPMLALCGQIFSIAPDDRVCEWYSGLAMLTDPLTQADGLRQMHAALLAGVDRVAPVTEQVRASVQAQFARLSK